MKRDFIGTVEVKSGRIFLIGSKSDLLDLRQAVSFVPGMGNGTYEVYAVYKHIPGHGERIVKVEVEFISDEEIQYLEKEYSDVSTQYQPCQYPF